MDQRPRSNQTTTLAVTTFANDHGSLAHKKITLNMHACPGYSDGLHVLSSLSYERLEKADDPGALLCRNKNWLPLQA